MREIHSIRYSLTLGSRADEVFADTLWAEGEKFARILQDGDLVTAVLAEVPEGLSSRPARTFTCPLEAVKWLTRGLRSDARALYIEAEQAQGLVAA
jgi:hypothetical protein